MKASLPAMEKTPPIICFLRWKRTTPGLGRLRIFENFKLAKDNIENDLRQWDEFERRNVPTIDPLAARNTWINSSYISFNYTKLKNLNIVNKLKYDRWHQRERQPDLRQDFVFVGLINKVDYVLKFINLDIQPKIKNELRIESPALNQILNGRKTR